jgi:hypothetical protein
LNFWAGKSISTRQVRSLLGCDIKEAYDRLKRLTLAGIVKNVGKPHHPEYRLTHRWRSRVAPAACPPAPQTSADLPRKMAGLSGSQNFRERTEMTIVANKHVARVGTNLQPQ